MTTDAATVANDGSSANPSPEPISDPTPKLPPWTDLYPKAPNPVGDPEKDTVWTMIRWGQEVLVGKKHTSQENFNGWASATYCLLVNIEPPSPAGINAGLQFDPLVVTVAEFKGYLPQLIEEWRRVFWNKDPKTPQTYQSRSKRLLREFDRWCKDPGGYQSKFRRNSNGNGTEDNGTTPAKKTAKKTVPRPNAQLDPRQQELTFPSPTPAEGSATQVTLAYNGGTWPVTIPRNLMTADIRRLAIQLLCAIGRDELIVEVLDLFRSAEAKDQEDFERGIDGMKGDPVD